MEFIFLNNTEKSSKTDDVDVYSPATAANHHSRLMHLCHFSWHRLSFAFWTWRTKLLQWWVLKLFLLMWNLFIYVNIKRGFHDTLRKNLILFIDSRGKALNELNKNKPSLKDYVSKGFKDWIKDWILFENSNNNSRLFKDLKEKI